MSPTEIAAIVAGQRAAKAELEALKRARGCRETFCPQSSAELCPVCRKSR